MAFMKFTRHTNVIISRHSLDDSHSDDVALSRLQIITGNKDLLLAN